MGPLIPLFWTSGDLYPSFKVWMDPLLVWFVAWVQWIPQIHLWCDTCWPLVTLVTSCDVIIVVFSNVFDSMATRVWLQVTSPQTFVVTLTLKIDLQFLSKTQDFDISFSLTNLMPQIYWNLWGATCLSQEKILNMQIKRIEFDTADLSENLTVSPKKLLRHHRFCSRRGLV